MVNTKSIPSSSRLAGGGFGNRARPGNARAGNGNKPGGHAVRFLALATVPLVLVFGNSMLVPVLPDLQKALDVSRFQSSLVITLFSITAGIAIPMVGYLSDRFGRKPVIIAALALYGGAGLLAGLGALWESYPVLISARALQGLGASGTAPIAMALAGDLFSGSTQSKSLGVIEASNGIGKAMSPIIGSLLALIVWYAPFFAFPAFCLVSLLCIAFLIRGPERSAKPSAWKAYMADIKGVFRQHGKWLVAAFTAGSTALFILFGVLFYLSDVLEKKPYNMDGVIKGLVLAIPLAGMVITSYTTGSLIKKNGRLMRLLMLAGLGLMAVSLGLTAFVFKNLFWFIGLVTASSVGTGLLLPCLNSLITGSVDTEKRGMITSLYGSQRFFGVAFGPPLFDWMMSASDRIPFVTASALSLAAFGLVLLTVKPPAKAN